MQYEAKVGSCVVQQESFLSDLRPPFLLKQAGVLCFLLSKHLGFSFHRIADSVFAVICRIIFSGSAPIACFERGVYKLQSAATGAAYKSNGLSFLKIAFVCFASYLKESFFVLSFIVVMNSAINLLFVRTSEIDNFAT